MSPHHQGEAVGELEEKVSRTLDMVEHQATLFQTLLVTSGINHLGRSADLVEHQKRFKMLWHLAFTLEVGANFKESLEDILGCAFCLLLP